MISPININQNSFKGFYSKTGDKFSPNQYMVAKNIKKTLGDKTKTQDFVVTSGAIKDSVELWKVDGLSIGTSRQDELEYLWNEGEFVGVYSKEAPFKIKDLDKKKSYSEGIITGISIGIIATAILLACAKISKPAKNIINSVKTEQSKPQVKDTIKNTINNCF